MSQPLPPSRLGRALERLSETLCWPAWQYGSVGSDDLRDGSWPDTVAALERGRLAGAGGPYVSLLDETARRAAQRVVTERDPRPLAGIPLAVKDVMAVAGWPLGAGSAVRDGVRREREDATIVSQLRAVGAIVVGLTVLHEFAFGVSGVNDFTGSPSNPHDPDRIPGGSSSGSAVAIAQGSAGLALGTDTGGSVRIPAALCGVVGFKPAYGTYSTCGVFPLAPSLDHVGLIAASVELVAAVHATLGHPAPSEAPLRAVGIVDDDLEEAEPEVVRAAERALTTLRDRGVEISSVAWPRADRSFATSTAIMFSEASAIHRAELERGPERYSVAVRRRLEAGFAIDAPTYVAAKREQATLREEVRRILASVDAVLTPTVPMVAPLLSEAGDPDVAARLVRNTRLANVVGFPALSLPVGDGSLPVGLQVMARDESTLLGVARQLEVVLARAR